MFYQFLFYVKKYHILITFSFVSVTYSVGDTSCQRNGDFNQAEAFSEIALNEFKTLDRFSRIALIGLEDFATSLNYYINMSNPEQSFHFVVQTQELIRNTLNSYFVSSQFVYQWCGVAANCFQSYLQQLQNTTKEEAIKQHHIFLQMLEEDIPNLHAAMNKLLAARSYFDEYSTDSLIARLDASNKEYDAQIVEQSKHVRKGNNIWTIFAKLNTEVLKAISRLEFFKSLNGNLKRTIKEVDKFVRLMKTNLEIEFNTMIQVKSQAQMAFDVIYTAIKQDVPDNSIEISVKKLINECGKYRFRHLYGRTVEK